MRRLMLTTLTLALGVALVDPAAVLAKSIDWSELAKRPDRYVGQTVEVAGAYCASVQARSRRLTRIAAAWT